VVPAVSARAAFLARTTEPAIDIDMRWLHADLMDKLHDLRGQKEALPAIYDPQHYGASQSFGRELRAAGSAGIVYDSVRRPAGQCVAVLRPRALSHARSTGHIALHWDGRTISHWFTKGAPHALDEALGDSLGDSLIS
jgi:RES domain